ncbi:class I SAM-dependent methyltransferase [Candidatus Formimonas warabiya]|uniref:class I SAM-dependent methyltransferase n=1 Tax=Formimonas warabiya TaxID=1761012 RepID=UPI0011D0E167|nr:class I SAM-dependent methyltransferase [Candidatus Formimonas warabiya]
MDKIILTREKETLLIPLYGKAKETQKASPILVDTKAVEIISQIDYDFSSLKIPEKTNILMCLRAKLIDNFTKDFLSGHRDSVALHLGCGLDSRYHRIQNSNVDWYDVDFKEVMEIRKLFFEETNKYHLVSSSVTEDEWIEKVPEGKGHNLVIAEGLFMYLKEDDIKNLLRKLKHRLGCYTLIFDAFNVFTAKKAGNHPSIKKTSAVIQWGIDHPEELERWGREIKFLNELYFTANKEVENLNFGMKVMYGIANLFPFVKKAQRLLIYKVC